MTTLPSLFLAHGAPDLPLTEHPAGQFLNRLPDLLPHPRAIIIVSAHWEARITTIGTAERPRTIHDFTGWPDALYGISYPARTDAGVIDDVAQCLLNAGVAFETDPDRGYDHGVWVPLMLSYACADVPVVQVSLVRGATALANFQLGLALSGLRDTGHLIVGSGATVHNLGRLAPEGTPPARWAAAFEDWLQAALSRRDLDALLSFPAAPQSALMAHPTPEHLMPFYVGLGAGWEGGISQRLHQSFSYGSLGMSSYRFG